METFFKTWQNWIKRADLIGVVAAQLQAFPELRVGEAEEAERRQLRICLIDGKGRRALRKGAEVEECWYVKRRFKDHGQGLQKG